MKKTRLLTKEYLEFLGIQEVKEDGTVIGARGNPINPGDNGSGYMLMNFRKAELGKPFNLCIHDIVWTWFNGKLEPDLDVHHVDGNPGNNALSNLIALNHKEHMRLHATSTREMNCQMNKPRSFYEDKLKEYEALFEIAKQEHNKKEYDKQRTNIYNTKARLRYWDSHKEEYFKYAAETESLNNKKQSVKDRKILEQYKKMFKEKGNIEMWHQMCQVINRWNKLESVQKEHVFEVLHKHFSLD